MNLSQLAAYAESKYRIKEEFKWADFPGFSVLNDPLTGKWAALLMRRWDGELGDEIELCDIKCGRQVLRETNAPYLSVPFRMKGVKWVGVRFDDTTVPDMVYRLFDRAIEEGRRDAGVRSDSAGGGLKGRNGRGASLIELEHLKGLKGLSEGGKTYVDTVLPPPRENRDVPGKAPAKEHRSAYEKKPAEGVSSAFIKIPARENRDVPGRSCRKSWLDEIPEKIWEMMRLYRQGDGTIENRSRNFYIQGKFMEDYEDDAPWNGEFSRFFTTYHDLNVNVLRGYFTWRAHVRKGEYRRITTSLAYLYLYELINGIGTDSVEDCLAKMKAFETGYLDSGIGDPSMRANLHRWMTEYAVLHNAPAEYVRSQVGTDLLKRDEALLVLRRPQDSTDEELFDALSFMTGGKIEKSPIVTKAAERGRHLLAEVWMDLSRNYELDGWDIFTACFGRKKAFPWYPLANAVYYSGRKEEDREYVLSDCRRFVCKDGKWTEERYDSLYFDKYRIHAVVHEADRLLRRYLKTGNYLRAKKEEEWVTPYVEAVIEADQAAILEASKPKITIDLTGLDRIRRDAIVTQDSLLTEEEKQEQSIPAEEEKRGQSIPSYSEAPAAGAAMVGPVMAGPVMAGPSAAELLLPDAAHREILLAVMRGEPVAERIRNSRSMSSVVTDAINEALFDEIGDNVLACDGEEISLVEDYREDLDLLLGGDGE